MTTAAGRPSCVAGEWSTLTAEGTLATLGSRASGLTDEEAARRLAECGSNTLAEPTRRAPWRILLAQFRDVITLVLLAAAAIAVTVGEPADAIAVVAIIVLNASLGFFQEYRAEQAVTALRALAAPNARVRRGGADVTVPASSLVCGDLVLLEAGGIVPADLRVTSAVRLLLDESSITGESQPVEKETAPMAAVASALGDRRNIAYKGTTVSYGRGTGVVTATGMQTQLGRVAALLDVEDELKTPLQQRLARLGRNIAVVVLALCAMIFAAGWLRGEEPVLMFMTALSLAVAAIPEALPAVVTVSLALGARKMARHHALIRRLPAVETLGSVTWICSDKTGTLTENRMRVDVIRSEVPSRLLEAIALCNDAVASRTGGPVGDPTETALYRAAHEAGAITESLAQRLPRVAELPFSSERSRMTTLHRDGVGLVVYTKGAPEVVLSACVDRLGARGTVALDHAAVSAEADRMAASGLRVLAVATRRLGAIPSNLEEAETMQTFIGLVGLLDPPRASAAESVAMCQSAGIRVVMITGDHPATAVAMARRIGIADDGTVAVTGAELTAMSEAQLAARVEHIRVYARVAPEDKIRIVTALQGQGEFVAMTGDGVNDAPALRRADIGIAMGRGGTDVAREASHMVLLDDDFGTIVTAVREGRRIHDNIRRFIRYGLGTNSGEIWTLFLAPFLGLPLPLLPIHILWMNLVTDGLPGLALAAEPADRDVMRRPPRPPGESLFARGLWQHAVWVGLLMAALTLGTQAWALGAGDTHWQSMTFTVLTLSQLAHVMAIRSERISLFSQGLRSNLPLLGAVVTTIALQLATLYVPVLRGVFRTAPLSAGELSACVALAAVVFVAVEAEKWFIRRGGPSRPPDTSPGPA